MQKPRLWKPELTQQRLLPLYIVVALLASLLIPYLIAKGRLSVAVLIVGPPLAITIGLLLLRRYRFEMLSAWAMIPLTLLQPFSDNRFVPGLPVISALRVVTVFFLIGLVLFSSRNPRARASSWPIITYRILMVALLLWTAASAYLQIQPYGEPFNDWQVQVGTLLLLALLSTYFNHPRVFIDELTNAARPFAIVLMLLAVTEYALNESLFGFSIRSSGLDRRIPGPYGSGEVLGYMFATLAAMILYHTRHGHGSKRINKYALVACTIGCALTFFRSSWLSLFVVFAVDTLLHPPKKQDFERALHVIAPIALLVVAVATLGGYLLKLEIDQMRAQNLEIPFVDALGERIFSDNASNSAGNRKSLAAIAQLMVDRYPLTGVGYGQFAPSVYKFIPYDLPPDQYQVIYRDRDSLIVAHNSFVQLTAECGYPALILLALVTLWPLLILYLRRRTPVDHDAFALMASITAALVATYASQSMFFYGALAAMWTYMLFGALLKASDPQSPWLSPLGQSR